LGSIHRRSRQRFRFVKKVKVVGISPFLGGPELTMFGSATLFCLPLPALRQFGYWAF
jgi:hypothetical protein